MILAEGQMLTFAEGEYSDYCVRGLVKVLKPFEITELQNQWEDLHTELRGDVGIRSRQTRKVKMGSVEFLPFLVSKGLVEDVNYLEIHTGSYGECEITIEVIDND